MVCKEDFGRKLNLAILKKSKLGKSERNGLKPSFISSKESNVGSCLFWYRGAQCSFSGWVTYKLDAVNNLVSFLWVFLPSSLQM